MKKRTLILSAAIVPGFALSTAVIAGNHDNTKMDTGNTKVDTELRADEQVSGQQHDGEKQRTDGKRAGEQQMSGKPVGAFHAEDVIGKTVKHRESDEDVGEIQDLIISEDNRIVGVVVKTSGFLGLGGQHAGLGWDHIERTMEEDESVFYTDIDEEALRNSSKYERD